MHKNNGSMFGRRELLQTSALAMGARLLSNESAEAYPKGVNTHSSPSELKITDLRVATVAKPGPSPCPIIRIDTNQGVYGLGEVRDGASPTYALFLKSRIVGENPLQLDKVFHEIKQFGGHARQGWRRFSHRDGLVGHHRKSLQRASVSLLEAASFATRFAFTRIPRSPTIRTFMPKNEGAQGSDGTDLAEDGFGNRNGGGHSPGTVTIPTDIEQWKPHQLPHPLLAMEVTDKGIAMLEEYVAAVRGAVGMEIPLSMDHLGHLGVKSIIRLGKAYEKYNLSWMEDVIPWNFTDLLKQISLESPTPILTGEDIYLKEPFEVLCDNHAIGKIQPDLATSGGILETHKIGDMAEGYGVPMALHYAGTPIGCMASVHCAAATQNFLALENHSLDVSWWSLLVEEGAKTPIVNHGWIEVPDRPGLGVTLNEDVVREHLAPGSGYFEPTPQWDQERSWDRLWS